MGYSVLGLELYSALGLLFGGARGVARHEVKSEARARAGQG